MPLARHDANRNLLPFRKPVSTHMPLARHDFTITNRIKLVKFLLTCLLRGMTIDADGTEYVGKVSTHMPLARHDIASLILSNSLHCFYSHASCEAWLGRWLEYIRLKLFLLTCLLRGMTNSVIKQILFCWFLLTCLLRGMTAQGWAKAFYNSSFYSHASCEAWHVHFRNHGNRYNRFYSHASCEAWLMSTHNTKLFLAFLLTCLLRGMTVLIRKICIGCLVSTHMPLARHDRFASGRYVPFHGFYSHASCEAWHTRIS